MEKVLIIAEAGVNHNGDINLAKKLIDAAVKAGVDYVKFQTFKADKIASKFAAKADYQVRQAADIVESQLEMLKKLELSVEDHHELIRYCSQKGIKFLSTPFDLDSIDLIASLGVSLGKVPSGEITNLPYLRKMATTFEHIILSTGMAELADISAAINVILDKGVEKSNVTVLHCTTEYPTPMQDVNLKAMLHIQKEFDVNIGYSDHTTGIEVPVAAVALGATVIEKHFTLDRNMEGPDHKASLEPGELRDMVVAIRNIEQAIGGSGFKEPSESERKNMAVARKSIVAAINISKGDVFSEQNLTVKRPGSGISPMLWDKVIGSVANRDFMQDELISL